MPVEFDPEWEYADHDADEDYDVEVFDRETARPNGFQIRRRPDSHRVLLSGYWDPAVEFARAELNPRGRPRRWEECDGRYRDRRRDTPQECPTCGDRFRPDARGQTYCSLRCSRNRKGGKEVFSRRKDKNQRTCPTCKSAFAAKRPEQVYCCRRCCNTRPKRMKHAEPPEVVQRV